MLNIFKSFFRSSSQAQSPNQDSLEKDSGSGKKLSFITEEMKKDSKSNVKHFSSSVLLETAENKIEQGNKLGQQGQLDEAIALYREAIQINPNLSRAHQKLAIALQKQGNLPEAMTHYRQAIILNTNAEKTPSKFPANLQLPELNSNIREPSSLSSVYTTANTSVSFNVLNKSSVKKSNLTQVESNSTLKQETTVDSEENSFSISFGQEAAYIYLQQALAYFDEKQWEQVISACQQALEIAPNLAEAYKLWGNALQKMGKTSEAIGYYAKAVAIQPDLAEVYANLGSLYAQQQKWEQAIEYYQKAIAIKPKFAGAYRNLAKVYQELDEGEKAWEYKYIALSLEPNKGRASEHWQLANQLKQKGQLEKAVVHYRYVIKLEPKFKEAYPKLAEILEQLGQWQEAATYYRHQLELEEAEKRNQYLPPIDHLAPESKHLSPRFQETIARLAGDQQEQKLLTSTTQTQLVPPLQVVVKNQKPEKNLASLLTIYRQKAQKNANSAEIQANLGSLYARNQQWQEAVVAYRQAIKLNPKLAGVYRNLARVLEKTEKVSEAAQCWYQAFTLEPDKATAKEYFQLGNLFAKQENLEKAIICYRQGIKLEPQRWELYHHLGDVLSKQEQWQEAIKAYSSAIELKTDFSWSYNNLGNALLHCHRWQEAVQSFEKAIALNPNFPWSHYNLGEALVKLEQWEDAIASYRQAQQLKPDLPEVAQKLDFALHQRIKADQSKALNYYKQALEQEPKQIENYLRILEIESDNWQLYSQLSDLLLSEANLPQVINSHLLQELINSYEKVINTQPQSAKGYLTLAKLLEVQGEKKLGNHYRQQALQLDPEQATAEEHLNLGDTCRQQGKVEMAIACYRRSLSLKPDYVFAYERLGELLTEIGQKTEAIDVYQQALAVFPQEAKLRYQLCQLWTQQQNWQQAIACYRATSELQPNHWQTYHHLGDALRQQQLWHEAVAAYRQAIQFNPKHTWSYYNLSLALSELGQWEEVIRCHQTINQLEPDFWTTNKTDFQLQHQLGDIYFQQQKWTEAINAYQQAINLQPDYAWSHYNLGRVLLKLERWLEASQYFHQATELDANFAWAYYHLGETLGKQKEWDLAIVAYRHAVKLEPEIPSFQAKLADALGQRSQLDSNQALNYYQEAIKHNPDDLNTYHKAIEIKPDNGKLYWQLANALVRQNQLEQAIVYYQLALQYQPHNAEIANKLKQLRQQTGQTASRLLFFGQGESLAPQPDKAEVYFQKGKACLQNNQLQQAIIWLQTALEFDPQYGEAYFQLGNALTNQANLEKALICYRKAIDLEPENCWFYNGYGDALKGKWDLNEALEAYSRAIQINPDFEGFYHNRDEVLKLQTRWQRVVDYCQQVLNSKPHNHDDALNILLITPYPPYPPNTGGAIRMFEQIKYLGSRHHLTVVSFIFEDKDYEIEELLQEYCDLAIMLKLGVPLTPRKVNQQNQIYHWGTWNMWKVLQQLSQISFDAVLFDFIFSTPYHSLFSDRITILNEHNIESRILQQCAKVSESDLAAVTANVEAAKVFLDSARESQLLENYENQTWQKFTLRTVVSEDDKKELERRCPGFPTIVIKNGIDTHDIVPVNNIHGRKMLYMGTMTYYPNIDAVLYFVEKILPKIRQQDWTIPFCIAGRDPSPEVQALTQTHSYIEVLPNPKTMSDIASQCSMAVVPIRLGSGTRIKILHAMAMGLPVISTSLGCEGLAVTDGENILICDEPQEFAKAVLQVSTDANLRNKLRQKGRQLVEEEYDWQSIFAQYEQEILSLVKKGN